MLEVDWAGTRWVLLAGRALLWPERRALLVADLHLGKGAVFRARGVPVPSGSTAATLDRLDALLRAHSPDELYVLGDLLHARESRTAAPVAEAVGWWRARRPRIAVTLVTGNHDRHAGPLPDAWGIRVVEPPWTPPGAAVALGHEPPAVPPAAPMLCGHVHPGVRLVDGDGSRVTLPCFVLGRRLGLLPAFGDFTGLGRVRPAPGDRLFAIAGGDVVEVRGG